MNRTTHRRVGMLGLAIAAVGIAAAIGLALIGRAPANPTADAPADKPPAGDPARGDPASAASTVDFAAMYPGADPPPAGSTGAEVRRPGSADADPAGDFRTLRVRKVLKEQPVWYSVGAPADWHVDRAGTGAGITLQSVPPDPVPPTTPWAKVEVRHGLRDDVVDVPANATLEPVVHGDVAGERRAWVDGDNGFRYAVTRLDVDGVAFQIWERVAPGYPADEAASAALVDVVRRVRESFVAYPNRVATLDWRTTVVTTTGATSATFAIVHPEGWVAGARDDGGVWIEPPHGEGAGATGVTVAPAIADDHAMWDEAEPLEFDVLQHPSRLVRDAFVTESAWVEGDILVQAGDGLWRVRLVTGGVADETLDPEAALELDQVVWSILVRSNVKGGGAQYP